MPNFHLAHLLHSKERRAHVCFSVRGRPFLLQNFLLPSGSLRGFFHNYIFYRNRKIQQRRGTHALLYLFALFHLKGCTLCMLRSACSVTTNVNILCHTVMIFIVNTFHCLTVNLQTVFRSFEYILECSVSVFIEASAAGFTALAGILPIHYNGLLAAAAVTVVKTVGYGTC